MQVLDPFIKIQTAHQIVEDCVEKRNVPHRKKIIDEKVDALIKCIIDNYPQLMDDLVDNPTHLEQWRKIATTFKYLNIDKKYDDEIETIDKFCLDSQILKKFKKKFKGDSQEYLDVLDNFLGDVNGMNRSKETPLTWAVKNYRADLIKLFVRLGAKLNQSDGNGYTPMTKAVTQNSRSLVNLLAELYVKVNASDGNGISPLGCAVEHDRLEMVEELFRLGAKIDKPDQTGYTPMYRAVKKANIPMIRLLLDLGANLNVGGKGGLPLQAAILINNKELVKLLYDLGAHINGKESSGETPLFTAIRENNQEMLDYLRLLGAKTVLFDKSGRSPLTLAYMKKTRLAKMLTEVDSVDQMSSYNIAEASDDRRTADIIFLAHVFGLSGKVRQPNQEGKIFFLGLEGMDYSLAIKRLLHHLANFLTSMSHSLTKDQKKILLEAFRMVIPFSDETDQLVLDRVKAAKPLIILGGTLVHAIYFVIYDNKLVVCNRGLGRIKKEACRFYQLPSSQISTKMIDKIKKEYKNIQDFNDMITSLNLKFLFAFNLKDLSVGNCMWGNAKAAVAAMLYLLLGREKWRIIYKQFTAFSRTFALQFYLKKWGEIDIAILNKIRIKLREKKGLKEAKQLLEVKT